MFSMYSCLSFLGSFFWSTQSLGAFSFILHPNNFNLKVKKQEEKMQMLNISRAREVSSWLLAPRRFRKDDYFQLLKGRAHSLSAERLLLTFFSFSRAPLKALTSAL